MKRFLITTLKLLVSAGLTGILLRQLNWTQLAGAFARADLWLLAAAALLFALSNVLGTVQWYLLLRAQHLSISFYQSLIFYHVGVFFNNVLLGNIGGDALRIYDLKRLTGHASGGIAATFMDRFIGLFSTCSLALAVYLLLAQVRVSGLVSALLPIWLGLCLLLAVGLSQRLGKAMDTHLFRFLPSRPRQLVQQLRHSVGVYRHRTRLLLGVGILSLIVQFLRILVYWVAGLAVGMQTGLLYFVCFQPVAAIIAALPISIGGLGVRENILVELFSRAGADHNTAFAMSLLGYIAGILASLAGGIAFVLRRIERHSTPSPERATHVQPPGSSGD